MHKLGSTFLAAAALTLALGLAAVAKATPLGVDHPLIPQLEGLFINITYNSVTDTLTANDTMFSAFALDDGTTLHTIIGGGLTLSAPIDNLGVLTSSGSISVTGTIVALGFNSGTLLTGTLTNFGFPDNLITQTHAFEFLFDVTGGDAASLFGSRAYVHTSSDPGFLGSFASNFTSGDFGGPVDIFIPEPSTAALLGLGCLGLLAAARRGKAGR